MECCIVVILVTVLFEYLDFCSPVNRKFPYTKFYALREKGTDDFALTSVHVVQDQSCTCAWTIYISSPQLTFNPQK